MEMGNIININPSRKCVFVCGRVGRARGKGWQNTCYITIALADNQYLVTTCLELAYLVRSNNEFFKKI